MKANHELHNAIVARTALAPAAVSDNSLATGSTIDMQGFTACEFVIQTGAIADADATFAVTVFEGDASDMSDEAAVADVDLLGTEVDAGFTFADDNATRLIGYKGGKRYVRIKVQPAANASSAIFGATALMYPGSLMPVPA